MTTRTGAQYYPPANRTKAWYEDNFGGSAMEVNANTWHSTEGLNLPSYGGGGSAPNLTAVPLIADRRLAWYQHFRIDTSSRALVNSPGGVETNTNNNVQVEIVGTCDEKHRKTWTIGGKTYRAGVDYIYMGDLPDWLIDDLADYCVWLYKEHKVPLTSGLVFKAYPGSYGKNNGVRLTGAEANKFKGHLGHQHWPENDHGDPGAFPMANILKRAKEKLGEQEEAPHAPAQPTKKPGDKGTLGSWPGNPPIRYGNTHSKIKTMQLRLRQAVGATQAKKLNPNGATGYYGNETKALVKYALRNHRETWNEGAKSHDGLVGKVSWGVINNL